MQVLEDLSDLLDVDHLIHLYQLDEALSAVHHLVFLAAPKIMFLLLS